MDYRLLGRSGLKVSALSIGTATLAAMTAVWGDTDVADAQRQIDLCLDHGVNLIDTANVYNRGKSETIIGEALADGRRDRLLIATKVRFRWAPAPTTRGSAAITSSEQCEASLQAAEDRRHRSLPGARVGRSDSARRDDRGARHLIRQGKIRYIGCSNYSAWHLMKALAVADAGRYQRFVAQQIHYTLHSREAEYELMPLGLDQGVGTLVWSPLGGGWLSAASTPAHSRPESGRQVTGFREPPIYDWEKLWDIVDVINAVAAGARRVRRAGGAGLAAAAALVASVIIGGRTFAQFEDNLGAADLKLTPRPDRSARRGQPPAADLSLLAPELDGVRPAGAGRPVFPRRLSAAVLTATIA
jgi:aryl-alcohol dehydrogenase-like predicted oxidoreductase